MEPRHSLLHTTWEPTHVMGCPKPGCKFDIEVEHDKPWRAVHGIARHLIKHHGLPPVPDRRKTPKTWTHITSRLQRADDLWVTECNCGWRSEPASAREELGWVCGRERDEKGGR